ncbi:hypothetical protein ACJX0J_026016, partial [Zea mays]
MDNEVQYEVPIYKNLDMSIGGVEQNGSFGSKIWMYKPLLFGNYGNNTKSETHLKVQI